MSRVRVLSLFVLVFTALAAPARADVSAGYPTTVFSNGFELSNPWTQKLGDGSISAPPAAAATGAGGLRLQNAPGQFSVVAMALPKAESRSATKFKFRTD